MGQTLSHKIIKNHLLSGTPAPGESIGLRMDQTLTQDATGTMACLQWEAIGLETVQTELSVNYVDHNTIQMGFRNPDDHRYLKSVAERYGMIFSPAGTGICHQLHLENFARPGKTLIGSDSHTPTAGGVGSLAIGAGGLSVALAMAGEPYTLPMPRIIGIHLDNALTGWASAKDVILALLGQLSVKGGVGAIMEYTGPGVASLTVPERATITNMGAELGATTSLFPSDEQTRRFLRAMHREADFEPLQADEDAVYDELITLDLARIEPMAACPHMPDKVVPVAELDGLAVNQVAIGSCTNSSYSDLKAAALLLQGRQRHEDTDLLIAPGSKQVLKMLTREGLLDAFLDSGGRLLECACGPCIGMGGSPSSGGVSVRTFNRNFEGRSGTQDGQIYLTSPLVAAQAALDGRFTDPATWGPAPTKPELPADVPDIKNLFLYPPQDRSKVEVQRGPNIVPLPPFEPLPETLAVPVVLKVGDNITTDHILPGGPQVTALRSNIPAISEYIYSRVDPEFVTRAKDAGQGIIVGGENYGQGSSREHAALAPRYLGIRAVVAKSFARIHRANLVNFGIVPLTFTNPADYDALEQGTRLTIPAATLRAGGTISLSSAEGVSIDVSNDLTEEELAVIRAGGKLNAVRHTIED
ncbi:aconitate hydratase [Desulfohalobium retbaense]|uniref:Aconitate hydratase A n=1 Tax=Desulfohalobium retbaense (strain ATCC 49708 / DSM 5692 / JCM 16813 / HR100) TaxID=485915 RepID=C8X3Q8_DESRD|nr:aconitate hydratase [Desulfohalobium retbaense]ACV69055.1 aconitate hydratase [Desulfohalobium retbaense DSM 5692]